MCDDTDNLDDHDGPRHGAGLASPEEIERGEDEDGFDARDLEDEDDGSGLGEREAAELLAEDDDDGQGPGLDEIFNREDPCDGGRIPLTRCPVCDCKGDDADRYSDGGGET